VAAFLCGVGPYQYYGMGGWSGLGEHGNFSDHWLPGVFDRKVGVGARRVDHRRPESLAPAVSHVCHIFEQSRCMAAAVTRHMHTPRTPAIAH
jgi:hypothetical protein